MDGVWVCGCRGGGGGYIMPIRKQNLGCESESASPQIGMVPVDLILFYSAWSKLETKPPTKLTYLGFQRPVFGFLSSLGQLFVESWSANLLGTSG